MPIRIFTWNMQGGGPGGNKWVADVSRLFSQEDADLVCLQECGSVPPAASAAQLTSLNRPYPIMAFNWNAGSKKKSLQLTILWLKTRMSGNLAMVGQPAFFNQGPFLLTTGDSGLLALQTNFSIAQGGTLSVYTSNVFFAAGEDPVLLQQISNTPNQATWFAVGDFNQEPMEWVWNQEVVPKGAIYWGHGPVSASPGTGTNMDYAFMGLGPSLPPSLAQSLQQGSLSQPQSSSSTQTGTGSLVTASQSTQGFAGQQTQTLSTPGTKSVPSRVYSSFSSSDHFPVSYDLPFDLVSQQ